MKEQYSVSEILKAVDELQEIKKSKKNKSIISQNKKIQISDVPSNTLKLIEEAEQTIRSKLQSE